MNNTSQRKLEKGVAMLEYSMRMAPQQLDAQMFPSPRSTQPVAHFAVLHYILSLAVTTFSDSDSQLPPLKTVQYLFFLGGGDRI